MDMSEVKSFNAELSGLYDNKPPISKAKMSAITKGAIKAIKFYKHVVHSVEKFIQKCKPEYKVPGLYVIDSIVRQSRHQFGQDKDVFAPRFAKNMQQTFANLFRCPPEDKRNIIRVLNLWQKNNVFSPQVIQPLLDMADPNHPLHQEIQLQQNNNANGSSLNLSHSMSDSKNSPAAPPLHTPPQSSPMGDSFQDQPSGPPSKFNRKLLNDFEYESEDEPAPEPSHSSHSSHPSHNTTNHQAAQNQQSATDALGSILTNPEIMRQLQTLHAQMQMMTGMQIPNLMPMISDMQMQQNQGQGLPFMSSQQDQQKQNDGKDDMVESDIEFVETGPQVIEIPDANDSRSPSPKSRRHRSRSKSPRRRRRSRSRSRSPRRRRDRDRDRDRERDREKDKDKEKSYKEREADREKQKEREKKGLPPIKKENLSVCSTTLWVGHLSKLATPEELSDLFGSAGLVAAIDVVAPRGCAFVVMERRRDAAKAIAKLNKHKLHSKEITVAWAPGKGVKGREWKDHWEAELGVSYLPWAALQQQWALGALSLDALEDGGAVDEDTLPPWLPPRILPKAMIDNMSMMGLPQPTGQGLMPPMQMPPGMAMPPRPPVSLANMPNLPNMANLTNMPTSLPPNLSMPGSMPTAGPPNMTMAVPRMPPPGMTAGMPPGLAPGMPPGLRPPSIPTGVPGLQSEGGLPPAGALLRFPPTMPPQPGMVGGFLGGLLGVGVGGLGVGGLVGGVPLLHPGLAHAHAPAPALPQHHAHTAATEVQQVQGQTQAQRDGNHSDDAMDLDTEDTNHTDEPTQDPPGMLPEQIKALFSKPPPNFNSSEPPPGFEATEPPPFNSSQPPPEEKQDDDKRSDRDRDRRDRDRDRRDRGDRDRRDRDRRDRDRGRDRDGRENRDSRDDRRDRDRDRGRDRRDRGDRDRDRERDRDRFSNRDNNNRDRERSRDKSPRNTGPPTSDNPEKSLQERLWEMANGKPANRESDKPREDFPDQRENREESRIEESRQERPPLLDRPPGRPDGPLARLDGPPPRQDGPPMMDGAASTEGNNGGSSKGSDGATGPGWTPLANCGPPTHMVPPFRPELRMRGPPRPSMSGPWMDGPGPGPFGPRFNGMGPPFNRPPFEGGPPRFERPPFNRMPFDAMNRPPFGPDGPRPPFGPDGPRPPFGPDGPRPPFGPDGPRPPFGPDGPRPPFGLDGPRPPFGMDGPRPPFGPDGPRPPMFGPDGPRPPFGPDGPRPQFDGSRPFDGPPFEGDRPPFDGPSRFDGPPEFFDRGRRFDDREQFNDRGWNGDRGDRDRDWDRRNNEWDDRRRDRRNRDSRENEDRFNRDRNDRRRNFDERRDRDQNNRDPQNRDSANRSSSRERTGRDPPSREQTKPEQPREEKKDNPRRERDRRSRWGAPDENEGDKAQESMSIDAPKDDVSKQTIDEAQEPVNDRIEALVEQIERENVLKESTKPDETEENTHIENDAEIPQEHPDEQETYESKDKHEDKSYEDTNLEQDKSYEEEKSYDQDKSYDEDKTYDQDKEQSINSNTEPSEDVPDPTQEGGESIEDSYPIETAKEQPAIEKVVEPEPEEPMDTEPQKEIETPVDAVEASEPEAKSVTESKEGAA